MRGGRKGLRYPGWEILHLRWSSIFLKKWGGTNLKLSFGGCFIKHPENGFFGVMKRKASS
jgi:hypothetical protein